MTTQYKVYPYRWVVLAVFMLVNITIQILWISYAPITGPAARFYGVSDLQIGLLSMSFMIAFIPLSIPVSWVIDTYGFRIAVGIGAVMMGFFGIMRGMAGTNYTLVLFSTFGIAAAQPFLLNTWTKVPANWFALEERATAVGMVTLASLVGTALGFALTPTLMESLPISTIQLYYGAIAAVSAILFIVLSRETPPTPPCPPGMEVRALMLDGLKHALTVKVFWFGLAIAFVGLFIFNGVTTWVENIIRPRGFTPIDAGILGVLMIVGGIIGAVVIPALSDKYHKRQLFLFISFIGAIPGLIGLIFATTTTTLFISAFVLGFFLTSAMPVIMQYTAEVTHPTPEGTSNGLVQLFGQASVILILFMEPLKNSDGSFTSVLLVAVAFLVISLFFIWQMKDPQELTQLQ